MVDMDRGGGGDGGRGGNPGSPLCCCCCCWGPSLGLCQSWAGANRMVRVGLEALGEVGFSSTHQGSKSPPLTSSPHNSTTAPLRVIRPSMNSRPVSHSRATAAGDKCRLGMKEDFQEKNEAVCDGSGRGQRLEREEGKEGMDTDPKRDKVNDPGK